MADNLLRESGLQGKPATSVIPEPYQANFLEYDAVEAPTEIVLPMTIRDCYLYGRDGISDKNWGCCYRVIQSMHLNILKINPPTKLESITKHLPAKAAETHDWLEPLDGQIYFRNFDRLPSNLDF